MTTIPPEEQRARLRTLRETQERHIAERGYTLIHQALDDTHVATYTMGLAGHGLPELFTVDLGSADAGELLSDVANAALAGELELPSGDADGVRVRYAGMDAGMVVLPVEDAAAPRYAPWAAGRAAETGRPLHAAVLALQDHHGHDPWATENAMYTAGIQRPWRHTRVGSELVIEDEHDLRRRARGVVSARRAAADA